MRKLSVVLFLLISFTAFAVLPEVEFVTPGIVRVRWTHDGVRRDNSTGVCVYDRQDVDFSVADSLGHRYFVSDELIVAMNLQSGSLQFVDALDGRILLFENHEQPHSYMPVVNERVCYDESSARQEETANGIVTVKDVIGRDTLGINNRFEANFIFDGSRPVYGLGSHMEDYMNLHGKTLYLTQHNLKVTIPVLNSAGGFGLLFDAGCAMKYTSRPIGGTSLFDVKMELDAARELDYYFIKGATMADVVGGYRFLTGGVSLMPRYLFGYIQSKERYRSSDDIISTLREYRRRHVPVDMIVQDWNYWPQGWGYMKMDRKYYPDPRALADSVHALNARLMVSIWPNPQACPQEADFRDRGFMLEHSVYDAFNPAARDYYWKYAYDEFFSKGFDAWWCDCSEPVDGDWNRLPEPQDGVAYSVDSHRRRWELNKAVLSEALGAERSNLFSLYHSMGLYENQRSVTDSKRVVNLTRSGYAGQQRYGTIVWNGDTHASWASFRQQIPAGLNYMATGNPYWTVDVGSFFTKSDGRWFYKGEFPRGVEDDGYKEYYVRMFQWATFLPMLRSHGTDTPREIWNFGEAGTPYYDAILKMIRLRYSLVPYIYSMAAAQSAGSYTMARPLAFDFPDDAQVHDIKDEYMFGDILVCPVTDGGVSSRRLYLPDEGTVWVDYWSGDTFRGGQWVESQAEIDRLPLFVRGGSIIPTVKPCEYTGEQAGLPIKINIYEGRDAEFVFYDDSGDGYDYEKGEYSKFIVHWDDEKRRLTIREGKVMRPYTFVIDTPSGERNIRYTGSPISVSI